MGRWQALSDWLRPWRYGLSRSPELRALAGEALRGRCPVCGVRSRFQGFTDNLRETGACSNCGASNRQRQMALVLRKELRLAAGCRFILPAGCRLYNVESNGALHAALNAAPDYLCSEYWGEGHAPGCLVNGIRHEDLENLSIADACLDIVLSSDVLEHVPDAYAAHREIFRVLRSGGCHIFTVPFAPGSEQDDVRARRVGDHIEYLAEPQFHGDPIRPEQGVLVWRIFGQEMSTRLREIGFTPETKRLRSPRHGIVGEDAIVFVARKP